MDTSEVVSYSAESLQAHQAYTVVRCQIVLYRKWNKIYISTQLLMWF